MAQTEKETESYTLAKKHGLDVVVIDRMRYAYDKFDTDKSGLIEHGEFEEMLHVLMKAKPGDISKDRITSYWCEIDADGSGEVDFSEYVSWYLKYFIPP